LREDNKYRRRLDYKSARNILNITYGEMYAWFRLPTNQLFKFTITTLEQI
jgi:hypothetical protein